MTPTPPPTLGYLVLGWMVQHLPSPRDERQPYRPADWQARRTLRWYELDAAGKRLWNRCHDEDPKGKGKSPHAGATAIAEFRGPVVFSGWARRGDAYVCADHGCRCGWVYPYRPGEPKGEPWGSPGLPSPWVQVAAVSEAQTANTWAALHAFLAANDGRLARMLRLEPGRTLVYWKDRVDAKIERVSSSAASRTGQPITHAVMDEPQEWTPALRGDVLANTILENLTKLDGWAHFTGNAPILGRGTVAETFGYRMGDDGRWRMATDTPRALMLGVRPSATPNPEMSRDDLLPLLHEVYEATPWTPYERILDDVADRVAHPWPNSFRLFFNLPWDAKVEDAWMDPEAWAACAGEPSLSAREPAFACVRIGHRHTWAAVAIAQRRPHPDDPARSAIHLEVRTFQADDDVVSLTDIGAHLASLRKRFPARVRAEIRVGTRGRTRIGGTPGPEVAYNGAFFAGLYERLSAERAALVDIPNTAARLAPAAETLLQLVERGELIHDGDAVLADHIANIVATPDPKGWKPVARDTDSPIVAALAAMLAVHRAHTAPRWKPSPVRGL